MIKNCRLCWLLSVIFVASCLVLAGVYGILYASLPKNDVTPYHFESLSSAAEAAVDERGIPGISAANREDALCILGFMTARDRLFQMDLLRRNAAGRLAEIFGSGAVEADIRHLTFGFEAVAQAILQGLPDDQKKALQAYAEGVNRSIAEMTLLPPEFLALGYRPAPWRPEDSLLVVLGMEENLGWTGATERMTSTVAAALPASVRAFLMPQLDRYTAQVMGVQKNRFPLPQIPVPELAALLNKAANESQQHAHASGTPFPGGSNAWVVGPGKTRDGRAILANDMHMALSVPNIWYRAELHYGAHHISGFTLPGVPLVIAGSSEKIAWGFTSIQGDFVDLVSLETDSADPGRYRTPNGFARFGERREILPVRGESPRTITVRTTLWGPVLPQAVLGKPVAVRWTALDPEATDLQFLNLDNAGNVDEALALFNRAGSPPLNALIADAQGNIGWTLSGKIPKRFGLDGSVSLSWADGARGWNGYVAAKEYPRIVNPPSGYIVNANQRMTDASYPYVIGHYFDNGYRAARISERLQYAANLNERDLFNLQLDTRSEFFRYYQQLALSLLDKSNNPSEQPLKRALESWDGFAETDSSGLAIIAEFRQLLLDNVVGAYLDACRKLDPEFSFDWAAIDEPLQQLLEARHPELLPNRQKNQNWDALLHGLLLTAERNVLARYRKTAPDVVNWGMANTASISHPFSGVFSFLHPLLDMPEQALPGCIYCVRWNATGGGASERLTVSPGHEIEGILHMPGGQSGHPWSPHYRDQQQAWAEGKPLPLLTGAAVDRMTFQPGNPEGKP